MIYVVTGQPRHGKSQYVVKMILDFIEQNEKREQNGKKAREIYCDIAGINAPDVSIQLPQVKNQWQEFENKKLWFGEQHDPDKPDDYVCPPAGSIFIYDECHKVDWIKDSAGALSKDPTTISMNEHGHEDYIFILITQFPQYIHSHLRGLVEFHYHVKRFNGLNQATIYKWNEFKTTPRAKATMSDVFEKEKFRFNKKYYNCYKSASAHDSMKFKMPKEWIIAILIILALASLMIWRYYNSPLRNVVENGESNILNANQAKEVQNETTFDEAIRALDTEEIKDEETEIEALREKYLPAHIIEMTKSPDIVPVGVILSSKGCRAINMYGEKLNIDYELCEQMALDASMMPRIRQQINDKNIERNVENDVNSDINFNRQDPLNPS